MSLSYVQTLLDIFPYIPLVFPSPFLPLPLLDNAFVQLLSSIQSSGRHYEGSFCFNGSHNVYLENNKISGAMQHKEVYG